MGWSVERNFEARKKCVFICLFGLGQKFKRKAFGLRKNGYFLFIRLGTVVKRKVNWSEKVLFFG